ncbi:MAG TPA: twin-arginine translocase subunit TatC [Desulfitobacterium dehalogenans]|uniref:Sec-independent protein translocase protein TatC n=1 Tax=Desulfitobacterium dehalogenans TaxID=36854 RepID=A0A7C7D4R4_9FIRM|nr:twin-arginine translocase subunit TatC [Desulfitobacterium dehalogenans]
MRRRKRVDENMPLMEHISALRKVFLFAAYGIILGTVVGWIYSDQVYAFLANPVIQLGIELITTTPMEPIMVKLKVSIVVGVVIALPIIIWQIWSFILPALKQNEKKYLYMIVPSSVILMLAGIAFAFFFVIPIGLKFLLFTGQAVVASTTLVTKASYLSFIIRFLLSFGLIFQLPVILLLLIRIGVLSPDSLARKRKYAFFGIVVVTMLISPTPELVTQGLMVLPTYMLYEASIWLGYIVARKREKALEG